MRRILLLLAVYLCAAPTPVPAQESWSFPLAHRLPEELVPLIHPLLDPGDVLIPSRNILILRASPEKIREIAAVIEQLDRAPHRLLVTVAQASALAASGMGAGTQVQGESGPGGAGGNLHGHVYQLEGRDTAGGSQQVQTLDGHAAQIQMGQQLAVPAPYGYGQGIRYQPVSTGFSVLPRLAGTEVVVEIEPWSERVSRTRGGVIDSRNAHTVLRVRLGEWIEVGSLTDTVARESGGFAGRSYSTRSRDDRILLKVEDLDAGQP